MTLPRYLACLGAVATSVMCPGSAEAQTVDWSGRLGGDVRRVLTSYYFQPYPQSDLSSCLAEEGNICFGGDNEDQRCRLIPTCHDAAQVDEFLRRIAAVGREHPTDPQSTAQAVYAFVRHRRYVQALDIANQCRSAEWWCDLLRALVVHRAGQSTRAEGLLEAALDGADESLACRLRSIEPLLEGAEREEYSRLGCNERAEIENRFWWLSDPMWSVAGNDRRVEHILRRLELVLHERIVGMIPNPHPADHEWAVVRRGPEDSWSADPLPFKRWASNAAAPYRFTPISGVSIPLKGVRYRLTGRLSDEGYRPGFSSVFELPAQVARFRQADSVLLVVASDLDPLRDKNTPPEVTLLVCASPEGNAVVLGPVERDERAVFQALLPPVPFVASIEAFGRGAAAGRARRGFEPLGSESFAISDLLLIEPVGSGMPSDRVAAVSMARGTDVLAKDDELAAYWEVYGLDAGEPFTVSASIAGVSASVLSRILRLIGTANGPAEVTWEEVAGGDVHPMVIGLDPTDLPGGDYELEIRIEASSTSVTARRAFSLVRARPE